MAMVHKGAEQPKPAGIVPVRMPRMSREIFRRVIGPQVDIPFVREFATPAAPIVVATSVPLCQSSSLHRP
jgi:hypothetical protein